MLEGHRDGLGEKLHWQWYGTKQGVFGTKLKSTALRNILWYFSGCMVMYSIYLQLIIVCLPIISQHFTYGIRILRQHNSIFPFLEKLSSITVTHFILSYVVINPTVRCYYFCFKQPVTFSRHIFKNLEKKSHLSYIPTISCALHAFVQTRISNWYHLPSN